MKFSRATLMLIVLVSCALVADDTFSREGGKSGGNRSAHRSGSHPHHHARSRVFIGGFAAAPAVWPWWTYAPYAEATVAPPVYYLEKSEDPGGEWLYCRDANGYFPHVAECAGGWQSVRPPPPPG
jgi:hypothetical protein